MVRNKETGEGGQGLAGPPARPPLQRSKENSPARTPPQNARKLGFNRGIWGWCLGRKASAGPAYHPVFLPSLVIHWTRNRPRLRFVRGALWNRSQEGGGHSVGRLSAVRAVLHAGSPTPVASIPPPSQLLRHTPCALVSQMRSQFLDFFARLSHFSSRWQWPRGPVTIPGCCHWLPLENHRLVIKWTWWQRCQPASFAALLRACQLSFSLPELRRWWLVKPLLHSNSLIKGCW